MGAACHGWRPLEHGTLFPVMRAQLQSPTWLSVAFFVGAQALAGHGFLLPATSRECGTSSLCWPNSCFSCHQSQGFSKSSSPEGRKQCSICRGKRTDARNRCAEQMWLKCHRVQISFAIVEGDFPPNRHLFPYAQTQTHTLGWLKLLGLALHCHKHAVMHASSAKGALSQHRQQCLPRRNKSGKPSPHWPCSASAWVWGRQEWGRGRAEQCRGREVLNLAGGRSWSLAVMLDPIPHPRPCDSNSSRCW